MELFSLLIGIGASLGLLQVSRRAPSGQEFRWTFTGLLVLLSALIGARLNYVLLHLSYYARDPLSAWRIWEGGLSWPGALILALLATFLSALVLRTSLGTTADTLIPLFPIMAIGLWIGSAQDGIAYGARVNPEFQISLKVMHEDNPPSFHWPLQYAAALTLLVLLWAGERSSYDLKTAGNYAAQIGLMLGLHTLLFSWLRADPAPVWNAYRLDYAAAGIMVVFSLLALIIIGTIHLRASFTKDAPGKNNENWFSPRE
jgi:prolipoprotein diacylglyceryltransferase